VLEHPKAIKIRFAIDVDPLKLTDQQAYGARRIASIFKKQKPLIMFKSHAIAAKGSRPRKGATRTFPRAERKNRLVVFGF